MDDFGTDLGVGTLNLLNSKIEFVDIGICIGHADEVPFDFWLLLICSTMC